MNEFCLAEKSAWILNIRISISPVRKSEFRTAMKKAGMKHLHDIGEWFIADGMLDKFQSCFLFSVEAFDNKEKYA